MTRLGVWSFALVVSLLVPLRRAAADQIPADKLPEAAMTDRSAGVEGAYMRTLHEHIHRRWADNFLRLAAEKLPPINPLNQPGLTAEADIVVAPDGQLISARIARGSGFLGFDDAILEVGVLQRCRHGVPSSVPRARQGFAGSTNLDENECIIHSA